jgi:hypothetical protein
MPPDHSGLNKKGRAGKLSLEVRDLEEAAASA